MPTIATIQAPSFGNIGNVDMRVILTRPGTPVYMEVTELNVHYVSAVCKLQVFEGNIRRVHPRSVAPPDMKPSVPMSGISMTYSGPRKGKVRATKYDNEKGKKLTRYFQNSHKSDDPSEAIQEACRYMSGSPSSGSQDQEQVVEEEQGGAGDHDDN